MSEPFQIDQQFDVIIVGTGMGGATLGYALARAGQRVLWCEQGGDHGNSATALLGRYPETLFAQPAAPQPMHRALLARGGRHLDQVRDVSAQRAVTFIPFIGAGSGGSTALYGMALERFFPSDFTPQRNFPAATGATLPAAWPVTYAQLAPYYDAAEILFRVRGSADPLRADGARAHFMAPPALTAAASELFDFFQRQHLHPYRLPMACEFVPGCACCQGYLCDKNCKNDARRICLEPALAQYSATLLDNCEVLRLEADATRVTGVVCRRGGAEFTLRARTVVLAAGALASPAILLRSASALWPAGLANRSGMVGKNLMRHHVDLYLVEPKLKGEFDNRQKEFAFNDFYEANGQKLGSVQSFGRLPPAPVLAASIGDDIGQGPLPWAAPLFKLAAPVVTPVLDKLITRRMILATTLEDLPYADNAIGLGSGAAPLTVRYRVRAHDSARIATFRAVMKEALKTYRFTLIKQAENNQRIAHACGTCRFGADPADSVLDANNRAHDVANLYVVDGSFFPSSGGTNPSLTIAANALRVAEHLIAQRQPSPYSRGMQ